ncbi:MAG: hypothetical protein J1E57_09775 [Prevotella sp.]|nr:hypothetical protein [Prevotella sp.]
MKKIVFFAMTLAVSAHVIAQEKLETAVSADVVNQYIWRGQDLGNVSLQPTFGVSYKGLSLTAWGSVGLSNPDDTKEFDITASYSIGGFNIGVTDYWFSTGLDPQNRYFKYDAHGTNHVFEANIGYDFGFAGIQWYTNFAGNDGFNNDGDRAYSSYVELSAPFSLGGAEWTATVGAVPFATSSYGTNGFAVTNVSLRATKSIEVTDRFSVPVFAGIATNPCAQKAYLLFGFTLQP